jgi:DNA-binding Lrp family transcriptional regulator
MSVAPPKLAEVGEALAGHQQIPFVAATTGSTNLVATVLCSNETALYQYLTQELASLQGILHVEVALIMQTVKLYSMTTQMRSRVGAEHSRPQVPAIPKSELLSVDTP